MKELRKVLWNLISIIGIVGYIYFIIKKDNYTANFLLIIGLVADNRLDIIKLQEKVERLDK